MPTELARNKLIAVEGIGNKTADVFLALYGHKVFPVDTHILRIGRRLGVGKTYKEISNYFLSNLGSDVKYHMALISHGRFICKARNPLCEQCYIRKICAYYKQKYLR
jgi:endonuclease-3